MRKWHCGIVALGGLTLLGCTAQPASVTPAEAVALLRTGQPLLSCREPCLAEWRRNQPQAARLDAAARWADLAVLVLRVGYQDDLSLYYLGRAAEGLGYPGAAAGYYRQSTYLSGTSISCQNLSRQCGGVILPSAASFHAAAIERDLNRPRYRRTRPATRTPGMPEAAPAAGEPPVAGEVVAPPPNEPAAPPPVAIPAPAPARTGSPPSEFIEPPPAAH